MVVEKQGSKSGGYVGGFLQLFDWNAKSRKKLFSSKSDIPELSKQKKRCDGNLPMTRVHLNNEDDTTAVSSVKGSSDYSCASSITDEEYYGIKPAGVVARLMGLDCLPSSNLSEPYSTPFFDSQSLRSAPSLSRNLEYQQSFQTVYSSNLHEKMEDLGRSSFEPKQQKIISRPIEKFQTEILPPKSAKSIPATHYKALSPIKRANSIPPQNAAHIMEIAARILDAGPQATSKVKSPLIGSSSVPLKYKGLKERAEASQKVAKIAEASRRPAESNASKYLKGQPMNKSWNGSADIARQKDFSDSDESFGGGKTKGKSVSLALQAKAKCYRKERA
uniref:Putative ovule protein n=1 Tax=Solanum chacoense TaxID=4108 RepID=A0A0V0HUF6_SOLCH